MQPSQEPRPIPVRIYRAEEDESGAYANIVSTPFQEDLAKLDAHAIALRELLRPHGRKPVHRELEPFTRNWFEELEQKRYVQPGEWLRRCLEFTRHREETLLLLGPGVGCDAVQYQRHGVRVTIALASTDSAALIHQHLASRKLDLPTIEIQLGQALPIPSHRYDLAYLNLLASPQPDLAQTAAEIYRVLKPGGKLFLIAPAYFDAERCLRNLWPWYWLKRNNHETSPGFTARMLRRLMPQYTDATIQKRHLRRSDVPYVLRMLPLSLLQRLLGQVLIFKAFKPIQEVYQQDRVSQAA